MTRRPVVNAVNATAKNGFMVSAVMSHCPMRQVAAPGASQLQPGILDENTR